MSKLQYDINAYLTTAKMSSKLRILVEGKDDKAHISNLLIKLCTGIKFKVDTAAELKGVCQETRKNNRAKIEKAHELTRMKKDYEKLFFLCDREIRGFSINQKINDTINGHFVDGRLSWTKGHSIENYFIEEDFLDEGLRFLTPSPYKERALTLFKKSLNKAIQTIACLTLAAKELNNASYPCGIIKWEHILLDGNGNLDIDFSSIQNPVIGEFITAYNKYKPCILSSSTDDCLLLCRGHTAIIFIKRIYAACLYHEAKIHDEESAKSDARFFENLHEAYITNALAEAWLRQLNSGKLNYPHPLVSNIQAAAS